MDLIKIAEQAFSQGEKKYPDFKAGDTVTVTYKIKEENKERLQKFRGVVIQRKGAGTTQTFTVRKISNGIGVERIFPLYSPFISEIDLNKSGKVRRAPVRRPALKRRDLSDLLPVLKRLTLPLSSK